MLESVISLMLVSQLDGSIAFSQKISKVLADLNPRRDKQEIVSESYISNQLGVTPKCWGNTAEKACKWSQGTQYVTIRWRYSRVKGGWVLSTFDRSL